MIKQKQQQLQVPTLEQVLEHSPLTVLPDTPLIDVIALMNPVSSSAVESLSDFRRCVLVAEEKKFSKYIYFN